jgi:predicted homoserine dehydrogenase-like protein
VTSFADGSKISFEQAIVANATGFKVRSRGMSRGIKYDGPNMEIQKLYDVEELRALGGIVDYVVGLPLTKVLCLAEHPDPKQRHYLNLYKMGEGPLDPLSSGPLRSAERHRARGALPGRGGSASGRTRGRGLRRGEKRPQGR